MSGQGTSPKNQTGIWRLFPARKLLKFFLAGVPAFLIAVPLNYALVAWAGLTKPLAYALVLTVQVTLNFFACRLFVFDPHPEIGLGRSFAVFFNGIVLFRLADWALYTVLTARFGLPFVGVQLLNVGLFGLLKFLFSRRVFERHPPPPRP